MINLKASLRAVGSDLLVLVGRPEDALPALAHVPGSTTLVLTQHEVTSEEEAVDKKLRFAMAGEQGIRSLGRLQRGASRVYSWQGSWEA